MEEVKFICCLTEELLFDFENMEDEHCNPFVETDCDTDNSLDEDIDRISPLKYMRLEPYIQETEPNIGFLDEVAFAFYADNSVLNNNAISFCTTSDNETDAGKTDDMQHFMKDIENSLEDMHIESKPENESGNLSVEAKVKNKSAHRWNRIKAKPKDDFAYLWNVIIQKDADGDNLLFIAIILLNTNIACMFIDLAPSYKALNDVNKLFQTALHIAALTGNYTVARRLLVAGAIVDKRDFRLNTALHMAVKKGYIKVAEKIMTPVTYLEAKKNTYEIPYQKIPQNLETFNAAGRTCLHIAALCKNKPMINLLLRNEADINVRDLKSGKTILHYFAEEDDVDMIKFIVSKSRLDLNVKTYYGVTAAELAYSKGHFAIAYMLLSTGASDEILSVSHGANDSGSDSDDSDATSI